MSCCSIVRLDLYVSSLKGMYFVKENAYNCIIPSCIAFKSFDSCFRKDKFDFFCN